MTKSALIFSLIDLNFFKKIRGKQTNICFVNFLITFYYPVSLISNAFGEMIRRRGDVTLYWSHKFSFNNYFSYK